MADADWVKYTQIRGKALPERAELLGAGYRLAKLLKRDFYAATGLYERADEPSAGGPPRQVLLKVYHTDPLGPLPLGGLGRFLARREIGNLRRVHGIEGVPRLLEPYGESGFVREFVPGCDLRQFAKTSEVDAEFFPRLRAILAAVHARGVSHNDLSKPENVLVATDGRPALIDFQIATRTVPDRGLLRRVLSAAWVRYMQGVDRYHLGKQHVRRRPSDFTPEETAAALRRGRILVVHGWVRRPYRAVRHLVLRNFLTAEPAGAGRPGWRVDAAEPSRSAAGRRIGVAEDAARE